MDENPEVETMPVELDAATKAAAIIYRETRDQITELEERARKARDQILDYLAANGATEGVVNGDKVLSGKRSDVPKFNQTLFKAEHPGMYLEYSTPPKAMVSRGVPQLNVSKRARF